MTVRAVPAHRPLGDRRRPHEVGRFLTGGRTCAIVEVDIGSRLDIEVVGPDYSGTRN